VNLANELCKITFSKFSVKYFLAKPSSGHLSDLTAHSRHGFTRETLFRPTSTSLKPAGSHCGGRPSWLEQRSGDLWPGSTKQWEAPTYSGSKH